jgi:hypothetical protein
MKKLLVALIALCLAGCVPEVTNLSLPANAGRWAKLTLPIEPNRALVGMRNAIENGVGKFAPVGQFTDGSGFQAFWAAIAGQSANVYFTFEKNGAEGSVVHILTDPSPPPQGIILAQSIDDIAQVLARQYQFRDYKLEREQ